MPANVTQKLITAHLIEGETRPGNEIALRIDQTLTQDATGTLVMLELDAMGLDRARTEISVQYVDHNLLQEDHKNPDDHLFLESACRRFGLWFSRPGNGVSHPLHQERFGVPGKTLAGSDSHTPAAGALGMLALGAGGLEVALAIAGRPLYLEMPEVWGIELRGELPHGVSAKDVILELLRRHDVDGGRGRILEYHGPGVATLSAMDRHVIANMGTELGATSSVFPSDETVRSFLRRQGREDDWLELAADDGAGYDLDETIDLSTLEPLIALPSSPGNVRPVSEVVGEPIYQAYIGSSANPGFRDFAVAARIVEGKTVAPTVSFDVNPTTRGILSALVADGSLASLLASGARLPQVGCNGCIGMGQAPASGRSSLRTVPRNFPGRSGTQDDRVCLVSPETAAASALTGEVTDPRGLSWDEAIEEPELAPMPGLFEEPLEPDRARAVELVEGPNIVPLPTLEPPSDTLSLPILLSVGDDLSTDEILPAGSRVLPFRSNIPEIARFAFADVDPSYHDRALEAREAGGHAIVAGDNYGQGSSREHAALAPRFLGLRLVLAVAFARIHRQNLINFGVVPLRFLDPADGRSLGAGDRLVVEGLRERLRRGEAPRVRCGDREIAVEHSLSPRQIDVLLAGGLIASARSALAERRPS
ncbi:MAG: aconitate hydratase [Thermoanaerobaculia bacterium]